MVLDSTTAKRQTRSLILTSNSRKLQISLKMPYKYIGKTYDFKGKTLWEIVGNLKNFGVGRIVARSRFERYPEPCYLKILKVEGIANPVEPSHDNLRKVRVFVERTFRGRKFPEPTILNSASYKTDYILIPKDEEEAYCNRGKGVVKQRIVPKTMPFPPLLRELIVREAKAKGQPVADEPQMDVVYRDSVLSYYRIAKEGETPDVELSIGLGKPASPNLYEGVL